MGACPRWLAERAQLAHQQAQVTSEAEQLSSRAVATQLFARRCTTSTSPGSAAPGSAAVLSALPVTWRSRPWSRWAFGNASGGGTGPVGPTGRRRCEPTLRLAWGRSSSSP